MRPKTFRLRAEEILPLVPGMGWCMASDRIVVDGSPVGYMYRETPASTGDSGWRFLAGDETDEYMGNSDNHGIYDVNTIANYDRSVIPFLNASFGSRFDRAADVGFVPFRGQ